MDKVNFRIWLYENYKTDTVRTYLARCMRTEEEMNLDLDYEFDKDKCSELLSLLAYSRQDERSQVKDKVEIKFKNTVDVYNGLHSIRSAIKKYIEFRSGEING